jgi:hypothetical protein
VTRISLASKGRNNRSVWLGFYRRNRPSGRGKSALASVALNSALDDLTSVYEKETGNKLSIGYGLSADLLDFESCYVCLELSERYSEAAERSKNWHHHAAVCRLDI